jgi:cold shock CspA family protein
MFSFLTSTTTTEAPVQENDDDTTMDDGADDVESTASSEGANPPAVDNAAAGATTTPTTKRYLGQVKFFNDVSCYGFITMLDDDEGGDVFVHINDIEATYCVSPTLFTGEYVSFTLEPNGVDSAGKQRLKATHVRGVNSGTLMCDHGEIVFKSYSRHQFGGQQQQQ